MSLKQEVSGDLTKLFIYFLGWSPRKEVFIYFQAGFPSGYFLYFLYFYIYLDQNKVFILSLVPP